VAVARKLAVIMHAMRVDGTSYCGDLDAPQADVRARAAAKERKLLGAPDARAWNSRGRYDGERSHLNTEHPPLADETWCRSATTERTLACLWRRALWCDWTTRKCL
jgi:hypothetical protein